jgi:hypothetical protein
MSGVGGGLFNDPLDLFEITKAHNGILKLREMSV